MSTTARTRPSRSSLDKKKLSSTNLERIEERAINESFQISDKSYQFPSFFWREVDITHRLLIGNWLHFVVTYYITLFTRILVQSISTEKALESTLVCLPFSLLTAYQFEIANQTTSPTEDKFNKPYRPIPAGLLTINQARFRWAVSWILIPVINYFYVNREAAIYACLTQACIAFFYSWPAFNHFLCRNAFTGAISLPLHRGLNELLKTTAPELSLSVYADLTLAIWLSSTIHLQESRDIDGDRKANRKTLPIILSAKAMDRLQVITGYLIVGFSAFCIYWAVQPPLVDNRMVFWAAQFQFLAAMHLADRLFLSKEVSKSTYHYFYYVTFWAVDLFVVVASYAMS